MMKAAKASLHSLISTPIPEFSSESERGNASAEFVMVAALVLLLFGVVLQVAFALYARNIMLDAAASGARYGTLLDRTAADGQARTEELIAEHLPNVYQSSVSTRTAQADGVETLEITVQGTLPVVGPFGFDRAITVSGHGIVMRDG